MIRFAIIGCGNIAKKHAQAIADRPDAKLAVVCDFAKERVIDFAKENHAQPVFDFKEVLSRKDIDVVNICTPSGTHAELTIKALQKEKHVVVEKPMALKVKDAEKIIRTAKKHNRKLCVVLQNRYNKPMQDVKKLVEDGRLGRINLGNITVRWYRPQGYYNDDWHGTKSMDGGVLMNQAIHHIDALQWLMGMPIAVLCKKATLAHDMEMEDTAVGILEFADGRLASLEASTICWPQNLEGSVSLFGASGSVKIGGTALNRLVMWKVRGEEDKEHEILTLADSESLSMYGNSHSQVIQEMVDAIEQNRDPSISGSEGIKSLQIVEALYRSAESGKRIKL